MDNLGTVEEVDGEMERVRKNKGVYLHTLVKVCQHIEKIWDSDPERR